jgi:lactoylglutathione lyase
MLITKASCEPRHEPGPGKNPSPFAAEMLTCPSELTYNYGSENDPSVKYHDGNSDPRGFGHICVSVDDLEAACRRFDELGVEWKKRLTEGRMKNIAFIKTPVDGYWIELLQNESIKRSSDW